MSQFVIKKLPPRLPKTDVDALVEICVKAFVTPEIYDLTGGDDSLRGLHFRSLIGAANVGGGEIWGAVEVATGKVVSLALCVPPGKRLNKTPEEREQGMNELMARLSPKAKDWREKIMAGQMFPFFDEALGVKKTWAISLVATDPDYQNRGLASQVIRTMLAKYKGTGDLVALSCTTELLVCCPFSQP
ncbi:hypothetical protein Clacol_010553 [Clathrus columnatus]|uniref:N-acetyltransferase domain-containing protein n=1 Tax=Clathrus columnatus TaxID=1419009 RepID=A0AAV5AR55_9AGAM|nr:hypothetical protein Clacol_010553 [Clathrus columnatus]